jgi:UDP-N-acetyl-D-mannosaminuronic acid transferase (WecB/TagA/CpsF family)
LEWAFRLAHDPARLFGRYFVEPWYILLLLLLDYPRHRYDGKFRSGARQVTGD